MQERSDVGIFVASVVVYSVLLAAGLWWLPSLGGFSPSDSLVTIPVVSVILSARAIDWRRRLAYAGVILGTFLAINFVFAYSGLLTEVGKALGDDLLASTIGVAYIALSFAFPIGCLLLFVGRDPSILWAKPSVRTRKRPAKARRRR
jgi:hypothetical protein